MNKYILTLGMVFFNPSVYACVTCNKQIQEGIWNSQFYPNLLVMLSAFIVLAIIVAILSSIATKRHRRRIDSNGQSLSPVPLTTASVVLGIGLGGFVDGIVLHQILQWHEMLSNRVPATDFTGKSINMFWDGIFHFFCLSVVITGVVLLWKVLHRKGVSHSGRLLSGGLLIGWGLFNIVEGIIDHHILKLHYVVQNSTNPEIGNFVFLGASVVLLIIGWLLVKGVATHQVNAGS